MSHSILSRPLGYFAQVFSDLRMSVRHGGPSTTKIIYVTTGLAGVSAAMMMTCTLCWVYFRHRAVDASFAGALSALWLVVYGFVTNAQNKKNDADKDIMLKGADK